MSASFRKVDYSLRPAKHAERRMLCEIFRKLSPFAAVEDYVYVGMGSLWFADFTLFHRVLGIKEMISIDHSGSRERIESNKPFRCITMKFQPTTQALPKLDWNRHQYIWLDYDDQISPDKLLDVKSVATRASSGTILVASVQCELAKELDEARAEGQTVALERFRNRFGRERIAQEISEDDLVSWRFGKLSSELLSSEINSALATRNVGCDSKQVMHFKPICCIEYSDGAKMTTLVGLFVEESEVAKYDACGFEKLDFIGSKSRAVRIDVPKLTVREIRKLEQQLPKLGQEFDLHGIPPKEAKLFAALYRYLPNFAVLET